MNNAITRISTTQNKNKHANLNSSTLPPLTTRKNIAQMNFNKIPIKRFINNRKRTLLKIEYPNSQICS